MTYYFNKNLQSSFEDTVNRVKESLKKEGFGVLTEIDVKATIKKKLNKDFRNYRILGACNPPFAHKALLSEDKIGLMLPCNVIIQEFSENKVEVAIIDPVESMKAVENPKLLEIATEVRKKLKNVIEDI